MPSIKIKQLANGTVAFRPHRPGSKAGDPLVVDRGALVTWNNETEQAHWPWPIDAQGNLLSEEDAKALGFYFTDNVPADKASNPIYSVNPQFSPEPPPPPPPPTLPPPMITYVCRHHPTEKGCIFVREG